MDNRERLVYKSSKDRLNIEVTAEQAEDLKELIPRGYKRKLFTILIDTIIKYLKKDRSIIYMILAKKVKIVIVPVEENEYASNELEA